MSYFKPANSAEAGDRLASLVAFGAAGAALLHSINVFQALAGPDMASALDQLQRVGGVVLIVVFAPLLIWFKRHRGAPALNPWGDEGYLGAVLRRAGMTAFALALAGCVVMSVMENLLLSQISAEIMLDIVITLLLALFSLSFFVFSSGPMGDDAGFEP